MPVLYSVDPGTVGGHDFILPLALELSRDVPQMRLALFYLEDKSHSQFDRSDNLSQLAHELGSVHYPQYRWLPRSCPRRILKLLRFLSIALPLLKCACTRNSILLVPSAIESFLSRLLYRLNKFRGGKTYTYMMAPSPFTECYRRYFTPEVGMATRKIVKKTRHTHDCGDGMLIFSTLNVPYLQAVGFNNFNFVGYPIYYDEFVSWVKAKAPSAVQSVLPEGVDAAKSRFVTIFINKYWGAWNGKDDDWARRAFNDVVGVIKKHYPNAIMLVQSHPTLRGERFQDIKEYGERFGAIFTQLHPSVLSCVSDFAVALGQSSSFMHVMPYNTVYIDYGMMTEEQYRIFPEGSMYAEYGTNVAKTLQELDALVKDLPDARERTEYFWKKIGHTKNLSLIMNYWEQ